jgi:hypothetical protein
MWNTDPGRDDGTQKKRWYQRSGWIIFFLIIFFPVGLYLMWKHAVWTNRTKWIITGVVAVFALIRFASPAEESTTPVASDSENQAEVQQAAEPEPEPEPEPAQQAAEPEPEPEPPAAQTVAIGEPLAVGDVAWVVTNATTANQLSQEEFGDFGETKQGNFVIVDFEFTNNSSESLTLDTLSITLIDSQGRESNPDTDSFGYVPQELDPFLTQVNPGVTQPGRVIFTVAPGASGFKLKLGDAAFFGAEEGFVNLGF